MAPSDLVTGEPMPRNTFTMSGPPQSNVRYKEGFPASFEKAKGETYKALSLFPIDRSLGSHWGRRYEDRLHKRRVTRDGGPESRVFRLSICGGDPPD